MAQLIRGTLLLKQQQERLLFMNCFGARREVYLSLVAGPTRAEKIASVLEEMTGAEDAIKAYAESAGHDISADLAAGAIAIAQELAHNVA